MGAGNANGGLRVGLSMGEIVSGASVAAMGVCVCGGGRALYDVCIVVP